MTAQRELSAQERAAEKSAKKKAYRVKKNLDSERALTALVMRQGVLPIEVMLYEMRENYAEAQQAKQAAMNRAEEVGRTIEKLQALLSGPPGELDQDALAAKVVSLQNWAKAAGHEMEVLLDSKREKMNRAVEMACLAAPYIHPKLANIEAKLDGLPPPQVTVNVANIRAELEPYRDAVRALFSGQLGAVIEALPQNSPLQPVDSPQTPSEAGNVSNDRVP